MHYGQNLKLQNLKVEELLSLTGRQTLQMEKDLLLSIFHRTMMAADQLMVVMVNVELQMVT